jgi:hypothetical protein
MVKKEAMVMADDDRPEAKPRLTSIEDAELRQLTWFGLAGDLSEGSKDRIAQLRARDRRSGVREPRPDPISQESDGRRYISDPDPEPETEAHPERYVAGSCSNCGYSPMETASVCPYCAVRTGRSF